VTRPAAPDLHGPVGGALAVGSSRMGGLRRGRRVPGRLGFLGVVRRVALTLAVVQSATSAVLAGEAASGAALHDVSDGAHDGSPGATSVPVTAHTTVDGSYVNTGVPDTHSLSAPVEDQSSSRADAQPSQRKADSVKADSLDPTVDATSATTCAFHGVFEQFDLHVLRQTSVTRTANKTCVTDALEAARVAQETAEQVESERKASLAAAKKKEKKIPSLRDFKSDLQAKVDGARDAKKEKLQESRKGNKRDEENKVGGGAVVSEPVPKAEEKTPHSPAAANEAERDTTETSPGEPVPTPASDPLLDETRGDRTSGTETETRKLPAGSLGKPTPTPANLIGDAGFSGSDERASAEPASRETRIGTHDESAARAFDHGEPSVLPTPVPTSGFAEGRFDYGGFVPAQISKNATRAAEAAMEGVGHGTDTPESVVASDEEVQRFLSEVPGTSAEPAEPVSTPSSGESLSDKIGTREEDDVTEMDDPDDPYHVVVTPSSKHVYETYKNEYNYASAANGAKVVHSNPESKSSSSVLKENKDSYYLTPCAAKNGRFVTVELSQEVAVTAVTLANFEFHSAAPETFEVWGTPGAADAEANGWRLLGRGKAEPGMHAQTFVLPGQGTWSKHLRIELLSHYGSFHFCTLSLLRVHGKDATHVLKEEMEAIDAEAREVEEILRDADDAVLREKEQAELAAELESGSAGTDVETDTETEMKEDTRHSVEVTSDATLSIGDGDGVENAVTRDVGDARNPEPLHTPVPTPTDPEVPTGAKEDDTEVASMAPNTATWTRTRDSLEDGRVLSPLITHAAASERDGEADETLAVADETAQIPIPTASSVTSAKNPDPSPTTNTPGSPATEPTPGSAHDPKPAGTSAHVGTTSTPFGVPGKGEGNGKYEGYPPPAALHENVFSIMAKKIKALELNQSMFDRYVEASNQNVAERFDELAKEMEEFGAFVANASGALNVERERVEAIEKDARGCGDEIRITKNAVEGKLRIAELRIIVLEKAVVRGFFWARILSAGGLLVTAATLAAHALCVFAELDTAAALLGKRIGEQSACGNADAQSAYGNSAAQSARGNHAEQSACGNHAEQSACGNEAEQSACGNEAKQSEKASRATEDAESSSNTGKGATGKGTAGRFVGVKALKQFRALSFFQRGKVGGASSQNTRNLDTPITTTTNDTTTTALRFAYAAFALSVAILTATSGCVLICLPALCRTTGWVFVRLTTVKRGGVFCVKPLANMMWWVIVHIRSLVAHGVAGLVGAGTRTRREE